MAMVKRERKKPFRLQRLKKISILLRLFLTHAMFVFLQKATVKVAHCHKILIYLRIPSDKMRSTITLCNKYFKPLKKTIS